MTTLDRYIARYFLLNLVLLFVVVVAMFTLIDLIENFDEFMQAAQIEGANWFERSYAAITTAWAYYWPRVFLIFNYVCGLLPIGAAGFTMTALIRNRELVAMLAGGISMHRIVMPIFALALVANGLMVLNQEFVIPQLAPRLLMDTKDVTGERAYEVPLTPDGADYIFTAARFEERRQTLHQVTILKRQPLPHDGYGQAVARITADRAVWDADRSGWSLENGQILFHELRPMQGEAPPSQPPQPIGFVATSLDPLTLTLRERQRARQLLSVRELSDLIEGSQVVDRGELLRIRHSRFSIVVINMLILAMGLPYFMMRVPMNLLVPAVKAAAMCVPAWAGCFVMLQIAPDVLPPAAVAWMPVAIYLPIAYYMVDCVET